MTDDNVIHMPQKRLLVGPDGKPIVSNVEPPEIDDKAITQDLMHLFNIPYVNVRTTQTPELAMIGLLVCDGDPEDPATKGKVFNLTFQDDAQFEAAVLTLKALGKATAEALGTIDDDATPPPQAG